MYNLVIITPDQLRQDYLECYGNSKTGTTNIDRLAADSVLLDECYCASPLCAPSRISFATSTYVSEHGHRNYWSEISPDVPNLVTTLKATGYQTGMFGKNHLFTYNRLKEVWDELDEICLGNYDGHEEYKESFSAFTLNENHPYNITGKLTDEAEMFIQKYEKHPFFLWINYQDPHPAFTCPQPYDTMFTPTEIELSKANREYRKETQPVRNQIWRIHSGMEKCDIPSTKNAISHYMGQIRYVDDCVGRIIKKLKETGLYENTVILFFSDHGELLGDYGMFHKIPVYYDCLTKIPVILKYPEQQYGGKRYCGLTEEVDIVPWILDVLGIKKPATMIGRTIHPYILEGRWNEGRESILCEAGGGASTQKTAINGMKLLAPHVPTSFGPGAMIRKGEYKLSIYYDDKGELYHLATDPNELYNLYDNVEFQQIKNELTLELLKRILGTKVRDIGQLEWDDREYPQDVRFEPLEISR